MDYTLRKFVVVVVVVREGIKVFNDFRQTKCKLLFWTQENIFSFEAGSGVWPTCRGMTFSVWASENEGTNDREEQQQQQRATKLLKTIICREKISWTNRPNGVSLNVSIIVIVMCLSRMICSWSRCH